MKPVYIVIDGTIDNDIIFTSDYGVHAISVLLENAHRQLTEHGSYEIGYNIWKHGDDYNLSEEDINDLPTIREDEFIQLFQQKLKDLNGSFIVATLASKPLAN